MGTWPPCLSCWSSLAWGLLSGSCLTSPCPMSCLTTGSTLPSVQSVATGNGAAHWPHPFVNNRHRQCLAAPRTALFTNGETEAQSGNVTHNAG